MKIELTIGESLDKLSILEIKKDKIEDTSSNIEVMREYNYLVGMLDNYRSSEFYVALKYINERSWELLDQIRNNNNTCLEKYKQMMEYSDARYQIRNHLNFLYGSNFKEQKNYSKNSIKFKIAELENEEIITIRCLKKIYSSITYLDYLS